MAARTAGGSDVAHRPAQSCDKWSTCSPRVQRVKQSNNRPAAGALRWRPERSGSTSVLLLSTPREPDAAPAQQRLAQLDKRRALLTGLLHLAILLSCCAAAITAFLALEQGSEMALAPRIAVAVLLGTPMAMLAMYLCVIPLFEAMERRWAPTWVIEESPSLVRVHGHLGFLDEQHVRGLLRDMRPGFSVLHGSDYGCVLVALPIAERGD